MKAANKLTGMCQCGNIEYEINGKPLFTSICHCLECQKLSGGTSSVTTFIPANSFVLLRGELSKFTRRADSGRTVENYFCPGCGNRIYHLNPSEPSLIRLKPGTLADKSSIKPVFHVWLSSRLPWDFIPLSAPRFSKQIEEKGKIIRRIVMHKLGYYTLFTWALGIFCLGIYKMYTLIA